MSDRVRPHPSGWSRPLRWAVPLFALVVLWALPAAAQDAAGGQAEHGLSVISAIILGLVEGFTEYLPVSSTGHLLVVTDLLDLGGTPEKDAALDAYAICIQAGAILAVLLLYRERVRQMVDGAIGRSEAGRNVLLAVIAAFIPTAIIGIGLKDVVRDHLFGTGPVVVAWIVGGLAVLVLVRLGVFAREGVGLDRMTTTQAVIIGVGQAVALWPGTSRSLVTIVAAMLVGLDLAAAVEFSFLLGLVTLSAATVLTALTDGTLLIDTFGVVTPLIGLVVAFVSAVVSVRWMVTWLQSRGFDVFGWYRVMLGLAIIAIVDAGLI